MKFRNLFHTSELTVDFYGCVWFGTVSLLIPEKGRECLSFDEINLVISSEEQYEFDACLEGLSKVQSAYKKFKCT